MPHTKHKKHRLLHLMRNAVRHEAKKHELQNQTTDFKSQYVSAMGLGEDEIFRLENIHQDNNGMYIVEITADKILPIKCPKCLAGDLYLRSFHCVNSAERDDIFELELLRCCHPSCDFIGLQDEITSLGQRLDPAKIEQARRTSEKRQQMAQEAKAYKTLPERLAWVELFKMHFARRPITFGLLSFVSIVVLAIFASASLSGYGSELTASIMNYGSITVKTDNTQKATCVPTTVTEPAIQNTY